MWEDWSCWDLNAHMGNLPFTLPENKKATTSSSLGRLRGDITPPPSQPRVAKQRMQAQMVGLCFFLSRYETLFGVFPEQAVFWGGGGHGQSTRIHLHPGFSWKHVSCGAALTMLKHSGFRIQCLPETVIWYYGLRGANQTGLLRIGAET